MESFSVWQASFLVLAVVLLVSYLRKGASLELPPGPKPLPIIGNINDFPPEGVPEFQHWLKHKDIYGPISSVTLLGQAMIIIHDKTIAHDLMEKQSLKTSSRATANFASQCGFSELLSFRQYDDTFRWHRKLVHQQLGTAAHASRFNNVQDIESHRCLVRILNDPEKLITHIKTEASAIILRMTYGYAIEPHSQDPLVLSVEHMMENLSKAFVPLVWMVDVFPLLNYLPEGLPGTAFKAVVRKWRQVNQDVMNKPFSFAKRQLANGTERPSYVATLIRKLESKSDGGTGQLTQDEEEAIKQTAAIMYAGGADTTVSSLTNFVLAMVLFPEVQQRAQKEIDDVVGNDRLPAFADRARLPYIDAMVKETQRWLPVTPVLPPHRTDEEMVYAGYRIPKGSLLMSSTWWLLHDPETYSNPDAFDPARYLAPRNEPDPTTESFGYGRRVCPGRYFATESMFINVARILAVFNISKAVDASGRELEAKLVPTPGLISRPAPFPFKIRPRTERAAELIRSVEVQHPWEPSDAPLLQSERAAA